MRKLFLILFAINCLSGVSQELNLNYNDLGNAVLKLINEHRSNLQLTPLEKDPILQKAAQDQSNYMLAIKKLAHEQNNSTKKYPKNRIHYYGGTEFIGYAENVLFLTVEPKTYSQTDIAELAKNMYLEWANSPPHYKNMITKEYEYAHIAFAYDSKSKRLYATNVFGNKK